MLNDTGTYTLTGNIGSGGDCLLIRNNNIIINGAGYTINGNIDATNDSGNSFTGLIINNTIINENVIAEGGVIEGEPPEGGTGGSITIINSTVKGDISSRGNSNGGVNGGNSGTIIITNSIIKNVLSMGGDSGTGNGGNSGTITIINSNLTLANSTGSYAGGGTTGNSGIITITSSNATYVHAIGGTGVNGGSSGANIIVLNSNISEINSNGGDSTGALEGGNGGLINLTNSYANKLSSRGASALDIGGNGGIIKLHNSLIYLNGALINISYGIGGATNGNVGAFNLTDSGFYNDFGNIRFFVFNTTNSYVSGIVNITNNSAYINSVTYKAYNKSANITFYGLPITWDKANILRDGVNCNSTTSVKCYNLTSLRAGIVVFNVSSWTNYTINGTDSPPSAILLHPIDATTNYSSAVINFSANLTDATGLSNANISIYDSLGQLVNSTLFIVTGSLNSVISMTITLAVDVYTWFVTVLDIGGNRIQTANNTLTIIDQVESVPINLSITYNFSTTFANINSFAQGCNNAGTSVPNSNTLFDCTGTLSALTASQLALSENIRASTTQITTNNPYHIFYFNLSINKSEVNNITFKWEGQGGCLGGTRDAYGYWYNASSNSWVSMFKIINLAGTDVIIQNSSISKDFINGSNYFHAIVFYDNTCSAISLNTDYATLSISYDGLIISTPTNNQEILNSLSTTLNTSQSGYTHRIWYTWNKGISNHTLCTNLISCQDTITFPRQGYYNLTVYANKINGEFTSKNVTNLFVGNLSRYEDVDDVYISDDSGNLASLIKFNITSLQKNSIIKQSIMNLYISNKGTGDSDSYYFRINNQTWNESINHDDFNNFTKTNNTNSSIFMGSLTTASWTSLNITNAVINDISNNFTSILFGDYDYFLTTSAYLSIYDNSLLFIGFFTNINLQINDKESGLSTSPYLNITYYSLNTPPSITNILSNNTNFSTSNVNFTFNISDDNDYLTNISLFVDGTRLGYMKNKAINVSKNNSLSFYITSLSDGFHSWYIQAYDSDGIQSNSSNFTFLIDTTPPSINIISPTSIVYINNIIDFNVSLNEEGSWCGYSLDGANNVTMTKFSTTYFNKSQNTVADGPHTITFSCNDTFNNYGSSTRIFGVDTVPPSITLNYPQENYINSNTFYFNYTPESPIGLSTCELWGNWTGTWHLNQSNSTPINVTINQFLSIISDGHYKWNVWCNSSIGTTEDFSPSNRTFTVDTLYPQLNITSPFNKTYTSDNITLNYTRSDLNLQSCWYNINNTNNLTLNCNNISFTANQGSSTLFLFVNDSAGNTNKSNVTFYVDSIIPTISLSSSFLNGDYLNYNTSIKINVSISDNLILNSCWYTDNGGSTNLFNCGTNLSLNLSETLHIINISANDSLNNVNSETISFTPDVTYPETNITNLTTTINSQTISVYFTATDTNLDSCRYSIFNSSNEIDGSSSSVLISSCSSPILPSPVTSGYGTYNFTLYSTDLAGNMNSTTEEFITEISLVSPPGGGGGGTISLINTVAIINPTNKSYTDLERALIYSIIRNECRNETPCEFNNTLEENIIKKLKIYNILMTYIELSGWKENYNILNLDNVQLSEQEILQYNLFTGIVKGFKLKVPDLDPRLAIMLYSRNFTYEIRANKVISNVSIKGELGFTVLKEGESNILINLNILNTDFSSKVFQGVVQTTDKDGNTVFSNVTIRVVNLLNPVTIITIFLSIIILVLLVFYRGKIKKIWK